MSTNPGPQVPARIVRRPRAPELSIGMVAVVFQVIKASSQKRRAHFPIQIRDKKQGGTVTDEGPSIILENQRPQPVVPLLLNGPIEGDAAYVEVPNGIGENSLERIIGVHRPLRILESGPLPEAVVPVQNSRPQERVGGWLVPQIPPPQLDSHFTPVGGMRLGKLTVIAPTDVSNLYLQIGSVISVFPVVKVDPGTETLVEDVQRLLMVGDTPGMKVEVGEAGHRSILPPERNPVGGNDNLR